MKKFIKFFLLFFLILTGCSNNTFNSGKGTEDNPYLINSVNDFLNFGGHHLHSKDNFEGKHFKLMKDLDFTGVIVKPVGLNYIASFNGHFDGNNHTMKNITINTSNQNVGLFGVVGANGSVSNLNLENINYNVSSTSRTDRHIGGIAGTLTSNATITNCSVTGTIKAKYGEIQQDVFSNTFAGGLVGNQIGYLNNCKASVNIESNKTGGIVGKSNGFKLNNCVVENANLFGRAACGGLIGYLYNSTYRNTEVYNLNGYNITINSSFCAGGMVGEAYRFTNLRSCFVKGSVNVLNSIEPKVSYIYGYGDSSGYLGVFYAENCLSDLIINVTTQDEDYPLCYGLAGNLYGTYNLRDCVIKGYMIYSDAKYQRTETINYNSLISTKNYHINDKIDYVDEINDEQIFETFNFPYDWFYKDNDWFYLKNDSEILSILDGNGTKENPYLLKTYDDLLYMYVSTKPLSFKLENDIDCENKENHSINRMQYTSKIYLDGNNKTIKNLDLKGYQIFATLIDSHIKDITFENLYYEFNDDFYYEEFALFSDVFDTTFENVNFSITANYLFTEEKKIKFSLFNYAYNLNTNNINFDIVLNDSANINFYMFETLLKSNIKTTNINLDIKKLNYLNYRIIDEIDEKYVLENNIVNVSSNDNFNFAYGSVKDVINQEEQIKIIENGNIVYPRKL